MGAGGLGGGVGDCAQGEVGGAVVSASYELHIAEAVSDHPNANGLVITRK